jgi:MFS family permease
VIPAPANVTGTFRSLANVNYRYWAVGALVSNIGTWMQRTAQAWLVLTQLTRHNASAVGIVTGLQFAPLVLLLPLTGLAADHFDRRKLLLITQGTMGALALALGALTVSGAVQFWHVCAFALALGCVTAFDTPARQTFVSELVGENDLSNAVALNSTSFNAARMIGPALAGLLIAGVGTGWAFIFNGASFGAALAALLALRVNELHRTRRSTHSPGRFVEGFRYVWSRAELRVVFFALLVVGTFGLNFQVFISTMSADVLHVGVKQYGLLTSIMAIGTVAGALLAARRERPSLTYVFGGALVLAIGFALAAIAPTYALFGAALVLVGISTQTFTTTANSAVQVATEPAMRGRVIAIFFTVALGGTPIGAPIAGWIADAYGPRWSLAVAAFASLVAAGAGAYYLVAYRGLRVRIADGRLHATVD